MLGGKLLALGLGTTIGSTLGLLLPLARLGQEATVALGALTAEDLSVRRAAWTAVSLAVSSGKCAAISALVYVVSLYQSLGMQCALFGALFLAATFVPPAYEEMVIVVVDPLLPLFCSMNDALDQMLTVEQRALQQVGTTRGAKPALALGFPVAFGRPVLVLGHAATGSSEMDAVELQDDGE
jgi:hypothetical protein